MSASRWQLFIQEWLRRHPLKRFPASSPRGQQFRQRVMQRIAEESAAEPARQLVFRVLPRPRLSFALATAAVCALALVVVMRRPMAPLVPRTSSESQTEQLTQQIQEQWTQLAEAGAIDELEALWEAQVGSGLSQDAAMVDELIVLAEDVPTPEASLDVPEVYQQLLEEAGDDVVSFDEHLSDEELLDELEWLESISPADVASS